MALEPDRHRKRAQHHTRANRYTLSGWLQPLLGSTVQRGMMLLCAFSRWLAVSGMPPVCRLPDCASPSLNCLRCSICLAVTLAGKNVLANNTSLKTSNGTVRYSTQVVSTGCPHSSACFCRFVCLALQHATVLAADSSHPRPYYQQTGAQRTVTISETGVSVVLTQPWSGTEKNWVPWLNVVVTITQEPVAAVSGVLGKTLPVTAPGTTFKTTKGTVIYTPLVRRRSLMEV